MIAHAEQTLERDLEQRLEPQPQPPRVAYIMSRFPKLTETFVLLEIVALEAQGFCVELFPLWREKATTIHPEAQELVERAHYTPALNLPILRANLRALWKQPHAYLGALGTLVRTNLARALPAIPATPPVAAVARASAPSELFGTVAILDG